jgi:hypothetical protein
MSPDMLPGTGDDGRAEAVERLERLLTKTRICARCGRSYQEVDNVQSLGCHFHPLRPDFTLHDGTDDPHVPCCLASLSRDCSAFDVMVPQGCTKCAHTCDPLERSECSFTPVPSAMLGALGPEAPERFVLRTREDFSATRRLGLVTTLGWSRTWSFVPAQLESLSAYLMLRAVSVDGVEAPPPASDGDLEESYGAAAGLLDSRDGTQGRSTATVVVGRNLLGGSGAMDEDVDVWGYSGRKQAITEFTLFRRSASGPSPVRARYLNRLVKRAGLDLVGPERPLGW